MSAKPVLKIDWATHEAAKYACVNFHYSKATPSGKIVKVGVWENSKFIGVVLFGRGAAPTLGRAYGCDFTQVCELTRVALTKHETPVSRIVAIAIRFLKKQSPGLRLIVSFADRRQGHHGGIYQAGNWDYVGLSEKGGDMEYFIDGRWMHPKSVTGRFGFKGKALVEKFGFQTRPYERKHKYLMPLDEKMRRQIEPLRKPYPKRALSIDSDATEFHSVDGGANPTNALQLKSEVTNG